MARSMPGLATDFRAAVAAAVGLAEAGEIIRALSPRRVTDVQKPESVRGKGAPLRHGTDGCKKEPQCCDHRALWPPLSRSLRWSLSQGLGYICSATTALAPHHRCGARGPREPSRPL